ncbi:unnamed protein product [Heligmosomoides polygyrus]|uniref:Uncharacterized protein n=1 Tax=Heligmosomoides polygyrus TaxID=6339 RepID=A0A3P8A5C7_HELPZ|nr:unnamed protein product [Heligmosomoides polygyrus]
MISDHETLASAAVSFVLPLLYPLLFYLCIFRKSSGRSREDIIQLVSDELDGMSKRRISRVLEGASIRGFFEIFRCSSHVLVQLQARAFQQVVPRRRYPKMIRKTGTMRKMEKTVLKVWLYLKTPKETCLENGFLKMLVTAWLIC